MNHYLSSNTQPVSMPLPRNNHILPMPSSCKRPAEEDSTHSYSRQHPSAQPSHVRPSGGDDAPLSTATSAAGTPGMSRSEHYTVFATAPARPSEEDASLHHSRSGSIRAREAAPRIEQPYNTPSRTNRQYHAPTRTYELHTAPTRTGQNQHKSTTETNGQHFVPTQVDPVFRQGVFNQIRVMKTLITEMDKWREGKKESEEKKRKLEEKMGKLEEELAKQKEASRKQSEASRKQSEASRKQSEALRKYKEEQMEELKRQKEDLMEELRKQKEDLMEGLTKQDEKLAKQEEEMKEWKERYEFRVRHLESSVNFLWQQQDKK